MATYQQYPTFAPAPARRTIDVASWALVAVIVAIVCGVAGWALARQNTPGQDDLARTSSLAARDGAAQGLSSGCGIL